MFIQFLVHDNDFRGANLLQKNLRVYLQCFPLCNIKTQIKHVLHNLTECNKQNHKMLPDNALDSKCAMHHVKSTEKSKHIT